MRLPYEHLDIAEAASEFHLHGRHLLLDSRFDELRELYAEYAMMAQWHNKKQMPSARQAMQTALSDLLAHRRPAFNRHRFDHIGNSKFLRPRRKGD